MALSFSILIALLTTSSSTAISNRAADMISSADRCTSFRYECFPLASGLPSTISATTPPQSIPPPTSEDIFNARAIFSPRPPPPPPPLEIMLTDSSLAQYPPPSTTPRSFTTTPSLTPVRPQITLQDPTLPPFDQAQCLLQPHCLICLDPTTTLTCYKHNCQCQRGSPFSHYMAASDHSCYQAELCLTCPSDAIPWTWGRMAVCLSMWGHRPVRGEANPLTNWTEKGVGGSIVGRVEMGGFKGDGRSWKSQRGKMAGVVSVLSLLWVVVDASISILSQGE